MAYIYNDFIFLWAFWRYPEETKPIGNISNDLKHFKAFDLQALASTLDGSEISDLRDQFNAIDMDRNGTITLEEMRTVSWLTSVSLIFEPSFVRIRFNPCLHALFGFVVIRFDILQADDFTPHYVVILLGLAKGPTLDCEGVTSARDSSSGMWILSNAINKSVGDVMCMYILSFRVECVLVTSRLEVQLKMSWLKRWTWGFLDWQKTHDA